MKISVNKNAFETEVKALKAIRQNQANDQFSYPYDYVPVILDQGKFISSFLNKESSQSASYQQTFSYFITEQYGYNLLYVFN